MFLYLGSWIHPVSFTSLSRLLNPLVAQPGEQLVQMHLAFVSALQDRFLRLPLQHVSIAHPPRKDGLEDGIHVRDPVDPPDRPWALDTSLLHGIFPRLGVLPPDATTVSGSGRQRRREAVQLSVAQGRVYSLLVDVPTTELSSRAIKRAQKLVRRVQDGSKVVVDQPGDAACPAVEEKVTAVLITGDGWSARQTICTTS